MAALKFAVKGKVKSYVECPPPIPGLGYDWGKWGGRKVRRNVCNRCNHCNRCGHVGGGRCVANRGAPHDLRALPPRAAYVRLVYTLGPLALAA